MSLFALECCTRVSPSRRFVYDHLVRRATTLTTIAACCLMRGCILCLSTSSKRTGTWDHGVLHAATVTTGLALSIRRIDTCTPLSGGSPRIEAGNKSLNSFSKFFDALVSTFYGGFVDNETCNVVVKASLVCSKGVLSPLGGRRPAEP